MISNTMRYRSHGFAKVNLALHICGRRADGYHLLDSVVAFALDIHDDMIITLGGQGTTVDGPFAHPDLATGDNLCHQAAQVMGYDIGLSLTKAIPVQAGIGGGSADAAAVLRALALHKGQAISLDDAAQLGADVPVCCASQLCRMQGVGEVITPLGGDALLYAVLVNPNKHVPTPSVFRALNTRDNPPMPTDIPTGTGFVDFLAAQRNDMQEAAISLCPEIGHVLAALNRTEGCQLARMSGSGATCFALYPDAQMAQDAARALAQAQPQWWCAATRLGSVPLDQSPYSTRAVT